MLELLKSLCTRSGVSGNEDEVREFIAARIMAYADTIDTDVMGNLVVFKKGRQAPKKRIMLCAHMDEVGVIVTDITEDGYLRFACIGGVDRRVLIGKTVFMGNKKVFGVIGNKAVHLVKSEEREKIPQLEDMYIDIGAESREEAEQNISLGDTGSFDDTIFEFGEGFIKAKAIDDRVGCAVLMKLIESDLPYDCYFAFSAQEEVGTRGAFGATFQIEPDIALIVEGTTAADLPSVASTKKICAPGKGVVIPFMDGGTIYDRELYQLLTKLAEKNNIKWQTKSYISGGTDAAAVQRTGGGVKTAGIAAPIRNLHSPSCVGCISDFESLHRLAKLFIEAIGEKD